jgi:hypothetical protein
LESDRKNKTTPERASSLLDISPGELADQPLGERPLLVLDLRRSTLVDLGRILDFVGEIETAGRRSPSWCTRIATCNAIDVRSVGSPASWSA